MSQMVPKILILYGLIMTITNAVGIKIFQVHFGKLDKNVNTAIVIMGSASALTGIILLIIGTLILLFAHASNSF